MKRFFVNKKIFSIFLLISAVFLVLPKISLADEFDDITLRETAKYLTLPERKVQNLIRSLINIFHSEWMDLVSSGYVSAEKMAVPSIMKKAVQVQALNHLLIDAPIQTTLGVVKNAAKIAKVFLIKDISGILDELEKESVKKAVDYGMSILLEKEIRMSPGVIEFEYELKEGGTEKALIQYIMIYKPSDAKKGEMVIRFYSAKSLKPPQNRSSIGSKFGIYTELENDLPPFIVDIRGNVQDYRWIDTPSIEIEFPSEVPDLGIKPLSLWEKHLLQPIKTTIKDIEVIITKVTGKSPKIVEKIENIRKIRQVAADFWNKIKSTFSKITQFSPAGLISDLFQKEREEPSIKIITEKSGEIKWEKGKEKKETKGDKITKERKENVKPFQIQKEEKEIGQEIGQKVGQKEEESKEKLKKEGKEVQDEKEKKKEEKVEVVICQRLSGDYPRKDKVIINEIAWMGTIKSYNDEWIELKNISGKEVDLTGWQLLDKDQNIKIIFGGERVSPNSFYLLERTGDDSVPEIKADFIYTGGLENKNEALYLFDENCQLQDEVLANPDWPAGDNETKRTMERKTDFSWQTSLNPGGTPKAENSSGYVETKDEISTTSIIGGAIVNQPQFFPVIINEIMYNPAGSDKEREWIEIFNNGEVSVDLSNWKFYEGGVNHKLNLIQGSPMLLPKSYAIITNGKELKDFPDFTGTLFRASFSLNNRGEEITLKNGDLIIDSVTYNSAWGADGDGKSLQRINVDGESNNPQNWAADLPTPSSQNQFSQSPSPLSSSPVLEVSPKQLEFESTSSAKSIFISNTGEGILTWESSVEYVTPSVLDWLDISPTSGEISAGSSSEVSVLPIKNVSGITDGIYLANIIIEAGEIEGSPTQVSVSWNVKEISDKNLSADETPPLVYFDPLSLIQSQNIFTLSWKGEDPRENVTPSGIDTFLLKYNVTPSNSESIYLQYQENGTWQPWKIEEIKQTKETQLTLLGRDGLSYVFQIKAEDIAGNESDWDTVSTKISLSPLGLSVVINEVAWMGTKANSSDEWIEFYNTTSQDINLSGWRLVSSDGSPDITFGESPNTAIMATTTIPANGFYLIERTDDESTSEPADWAGSFGKGGLANNPNCEVLSLYDPYENLIDQTSCLEKNHWPAGNGSPSYISMERIDSTKSGSDPLNWTNNNLISKNGLDTEGNKINGTPKAKNSVSKSQTEISGSIDFPTLTYLGSPYIVSNFLNLPSNQTLNIEPGVKIKFDSKAYFLIEGKLLADGTQERKIIFTSNKENPSPGDWGWLYFKNSSGSQLKNTIFRYGGGIDNNYLSSAPDYTRGTIQVENGGITIEDSAIEKSLTIGLWLINSSSTINRVNFLEIEGTEFYEKTAGVFIDGGNPVIKNSLFKGNKIGIEIKSNANPAIEENIFENNKIPIHFDASSPYFQNNSAQNNEINGILVESVSSSTTWQPDLPYVIATGSVASDSTLTISPGVIIKFKDEGRFDIFGEFIAKGTLKNPIIFTSIKDDYYGGDTNNDSSITQVTPSDWDAIHFHSSGSLLENVIVRYGGKEGISSLGAITIGDDTKTDVKINISDSLIENNIYGIYYFGNCEGLNNNVLLENVTLFENKYDFYPFCSP